ncbi:MAG TPA: DNA repair exonuclease, partial [Deltaproteobacteria bacterium]|nr:DNA repair exonuclease [Deltaproteobacteria bacterium]
MFRFLHAADIHLDSPLRGLERYDEVLAEEVRGAPRRALENLVGLAIEEDVAFVLIAGDLYDGDWRDYNTGIFFVRQMRRLEKAGIPVHLVSGNHDAASCITKRLRLPPNVVHYSEKHPETRLLPDLGVAIHGQSFAGREVREDLSSAYPAAKPGHFNIGLLHTSLDGRPGHAVYAPCNVTGLRSKGYDYWALGHVHEREVVSQDPWIVFPGNIQGRHVRELGSRGCSLVTVDDGMVRDLEHRSVDVVRWARIEVDLSGIPAAEDSIDRVRQEIERVCQDAEDRTVAVRIVLGGRSPAHEALVGNPERWIHEYREQASAVPGAAVHVERILFETRPERELAWRVGRTEEREDALGDLLDLIARLDQDSVDLAELGGLFDEFAKRLPAPLLGKEEGFDPTAARTIREALPAA